MQRYGRFQPFANLCKVCNNLEIRIFFLKNRLLLQPPEIAPAGLELAVVAVADELSQELLGIIHAGGVVVVLDAVHLDATVVLRAGLEELPGLVIGPNGVQNPVLEDEAGGVQRRRHGQTGSHLIKDGHLYRIPRCYQLSQAHKADIDYKIAHYLVPEKVRFQWQDSDYHD